MTLLARCKSEYIPGLERGNVMNLLILKEHYIQVSRKASIFQGFSAATIFEQWNWFDFKRF